MASLNLIPNPAVMAAQAGIFLTSMFVIKKLMLDPYLTVRAKRESLTTGSQADAKQALAESDRIATDLALRIRTTAESAKSEKEVVRQAALVKRQAIVENAEKEASKTVADAASRIAKDLADERAKVPAIVKSITDQIYSVVLN